MARELDHERGAGVLAAAQVSGSGQRDQHGRRAEEADAQVGERVRSDAGRRAHRAYHRRCDDEPHDRERHAEPEREPDAVDALLRGPGAVAGADPARDRGGGGVGEEVEDPERDGEQGSGDGEPGERPGAEVADDRGVGEDVERFGREGAEGRQRQAQDLAVAGIAPPDRHVPTLGDVV